MSESENGQNDRHRLRQQRLKEVVDQGIARADKERGIVLVHTGNGKGKSSGAFGMVMRTLGHGMNAAVVQFIKAPMQTGEERFLREFTQVPFHATGEGFSWETQNRERDMEKVRAGWEIALGYLRDPQIHLLVLDELNIVLKMHYLPLDDVLEGLRGRPEMQHVVVTGRGAPEGLIEYADTVTEMREIKHAYHAGIKAQKGVEM